MLPLKSTNATKLYKHAASWFRQPIYAAYIYRTFWTFDWRYEVQFNCNSGLNFFFLAVGNLQLFNFSKSALKVDGSLEWETQTAAVRNVPSLVCHHWLCTERTERFAKTS